MSRSFCVALTASGFLFPLTALAADGVVVSADRRGLAIEDVPQSVTLIDADALRIQSADHVSEVLARAPGVSLHRGSGAEHLTAIRSPVLTGGAGAGSFLYLENGVPIRSPGFANINGLFDAHYEIAGAVEIVRGPSGAVYGANAIHGVVNVLSPAPTSDLSAFAEIFGDTEDRYKWKGVVSNGFGNQKLLVGFSATSESGYRRSAGLDQQKVTARHQWDGDGVNVDTIFSFHNLEQETAGFIFGADTLLDPDRRRDNDFPDAYRDAKSARLQSTITWEAGDNTQIKLTPYARWNQMEFPQHFLPSNALENNDHWSVGAQSAVYTTLGAISIIAGVDAEYTEGALREFQERPRIFSFTQGLHYDYAVRALNASGFVQGDYDVTDRTRVSVAVRVDGTIYDYDNRTDSGVVGRFLRLDDQVDRFVTASPKFSIQHEFSDRASGYVSYARGARPPQTTDLYRVQTDPTGTQSGGTARPELIDSVEVGARGRIGDVANVTIAGFFMDKRNFFFRDADRFTVANGKTRHVGVEADLRIKLHETVELASAVTYAAHTYRFDRNAITNPGSRENITSGDDVDSAPRVLANTRLSWRPTDRLKMQAEWVSVGSYYTDAANAHQYGGHNLLHLRGEADITDNLSVFLTLRNVTDELYAERADFAFGNDRFFPGEERTFGFGLRGQL